MTTTHRLTAYPIYPGITEKFPFVFVIQEEDDDVFTAYGLRLLIEPVGEVCDFCGRDNADAYVEHGATGTPDVGVPVHVRCVLDRTFDLDTVGGSIHRTQDVTLVNAP